uniref:Uncharacterized protein n=1 Tax=Medicago truncatula TaxID=3880 RepID=I3T0Y4_MEDTR|nr:unknown [Medicago truncatula]
MIHITNKIHNSSYRHQFTILIAEFVN